MPLIEHLRELRGRLVKGLIALAATTSIAYAFAPRLFDFLKAPLVRELGPNRALIYTSPAEVFVTNIKVAVLAGVFAASPYLFYQVWKFVMPGLYPKERRYVVPFVVAATLFFVGGAAFGYFVMFPFGFRFFIGGFQTASIQAMIQVEAYFRFTTKMLLAFGIAFELPIVVLFLARMGLVDARFLVKNFRYAFLILAIAAAVFTPPDILSMGLMLAPLTVLYALSIGAAAVFGKKKEAEDPPPESEDAPNAG
jgi:sec-independent protein translocase protein TatC